MCICACYTAKPLKPTCKAAIRNVLERPALRGAACPLLVRLLCVGVAGGNVQQRWWGGDTAAGAVAPCMLLLLLLLLLRTRPVLQGQRRLAAAAGQVQYAYGDVGLLAELLRRHQERDGPHDLIVVRV